MGVDDEPTTHQEAPAPSAGQALSAPAGGTEAASGTSAPAPRRRRAARRPAGPPKSGQESTEPGSEQGSGNASRDADQHGDLNGAPGGVPDTGAPEAGTAPAPAARKRASRSRRTPASAPVETPQTEAGTRPEGGPDQPTAPAETAAETKAEEPGPAPRRRRSRKASTPASVPADGPTAADAASGDTPADSPRQAAAEPAEAPVEVEAPVEAEAGTGRKPARSRARRRSGATATTPPATESGTGTAPGAGTDPAGAGTGSKAGSAVASEAGSAVASGAVGAAGATRAPDGVGAGVEDGDEDGVDRPSALSMPLFRAPDLDAPPRRRRAASRPAGPPVSGAAGAEAAGEVPARPEESEPEAPDEEETTAEGGPDEDETAEPGRRRRRRRGGRGRRGRGRDGEDDEETPAESGDAETSPAADPATEEETPEEEEAAESGGSRRRRRRRRRGNASDAEPGPDDPPNTVVKVREGRRSGGDDVTGVKGSTRLEAKKQRRREGREAGRRRPVITEAEFLARREAVDRVMVVRERDGRTQIGVLEDGVLVEHYVARRTQTSTVGNVYLGKVQNVLPSMEAAFIDIGKGRNAVLYAGEVNWDAAGLDGQPKRIEHALKSGESVLVQVTKDPIGHKGARLTSQVSLPGRYLVYVPEGSMTGISRKLPDIERARLKKILRSVVPDNAGVIVRTAAEGASEEELERDVSRLQAQWEDIARKAGAVNAPALLYGEPDLAIRVVRDIFNEDFGRLIVSGDEAWETLQSYIGHVAPDLVDRMQRWEGEQDVFATHRIDEQLAKALERKVWLPSGGSLVIDRTEAMTVIDVNTGKYTGSGGNLEETVTKNNLEAAEEIVRQLRLRDIGGIIVVDFIDMVLESNRDLVLRRLLEALGRDRTKHQVAEVTSLGLVQMTRKRVGQGLLEVFSETCEVCAGRGVLLHEEPVEKRASGQQESGGRQRGRGRGGKDGAKDGSGSAAKEGSGAKDGSGAGSGSAAKEGSGAKDGSGSGAKGGKGGKGGKKDQGGKKGQGGAREASDPDQDAGAGTVPDQAGGQPDGQAGGPEPSSGD